MSKMIRILGIAGSLRRQSYNRAVLRAAAELAPADAAVEIFEIDGIPPFSEDDEQDPPAKVVELKNRIRESDAVLFVTPEYNYSIPGVLKNAIDWASRPPDMPFVGKPVAMMGAAPGLMGTVRAQLHLRQILSGLNMPVLSRPEVLIREAAAKFDADGRLTDEDTRKHIRNLLEKLRDWTLLLKGAPG